MIRGSPCLACSASMAPDGSAETSILGFPLRPGTLFILARVPSHSKKVDQTGHV